MPAVDVALTGTDRGLRATLARATSAVSGFVGQTLAAQGALAAFRSPAVALTAATAGLAAAAVAARNSARAMADLQRSADALGESSPRLRRFAQTVETIAGVEFGELAEALRTLQERVGEAVADPASNIGQAFRAIEADARRLADLPAIDQMNAFVAALERLPRAEREFRARELGNDVAAVAIPLANYAGAVERVNRELRAGAQLHDGLAAAAVEADREFSLFGQTLDTIWTNAFNAIAIYYAPALRQLRHDIEGVSNAIVPAPAPPATVEGLDAAEAGVKRLIAAGAALQEQFRRARKEASDAGEWDVADGLTADLATVNAELERLRADLAALDAERRRLDEDGPRPVRRSVADRAVDELLAAERRRVAELAAVEAKLRELRSGGGDAGEIAALEAARQSLQPRQAALDIERATLEVEVERAEAAARRAGLDARAVELATIDERIARATVDADIESLEALRAAVVERHRREDAAEAERRATAAVAALEREIHGARQTTRAQLLDELDVTEEIVAGNARLAELVRIRTAELDTSADAERADAIRAAVDAETALVSGTAEEAALQRVILALKQAGLAVTRAEAAEIARQIDEALAQAGEDRLRDGIKGAVEGGLRDGLRQFADGGDIGDVFDEIGRRLLDTLLDAAIGSFGRGGGQGTGLLGALGGLFGGRRERGGPVDAGRLYLVGERGPELFMPRSAGRVLAGVAAAGPAVTQNITVQGSVRSDADVAAIAQRVAQQSAAGLARAIANGRLGVAA